MTLPVFPTFPGVGFPVKRTPEWSTQTQTSVNGKRTTWGFFTYPIYHFEITLDEGDDAFLRSGTAYLEQQELLAFYNSRGGPRDMFTYTDPFDKTATTERFGTGDGVTLNFQLGRNVAGYANSWFDPFYSVSGVSVFKNGVLQTLGVDYTLSTTGVVAFAVAPAITAALNWSGTFSFVCRFESDTQEFSNFMLNLWSANNLRFSTETSPVF